MSASSTAELSAFLRPSLSGVTLYLTVGNSFRGDDGAGPYLASRLREDPGVCVVDAGFTPENIVDEVVALRPSRIIVLDAADFGGAPGEARLICENELPQASLSTHMIPVYVITKIIQESTPCDVYFIGIQKKAIEIGCETLSPEVRASTDRLADMIVSAHHDDRR